MVACPLSADANDGDCDDGGDGAEFASCGFATDCNDCGVRTTLDFPPLLPPSMPPRPSVPRPPASPPFPPVVPPIPAMPGGAYQEEVAVDLTLGESIESIDTEALKRDLLSTFPSADEVILTLRAASVSVQARFITHNASRAAETAEAISRRTVSDLQTDIGIVVVAATKPVVLTVLTAAPSPPVPPLLPPLPAMPPFAPDVVAVSSVGELRGVLGSLPTGRTVTIFLAGGQRFVLCDTKVRDSCAEAALIIPANTSVILSSDSRGGSTAIDGVGRTRHFKVKGQLELHDITLVAGDAQWGGALIVFSGGTV